MLCLEVSRHLKIVFPSRQMVMSSPSGPDVSRKSAVFSNICPAKAQRSQFCLGIYDCIFKWKSLQLKGISQSLAVPLVRKNWHHQHAFKGILLNDTFINNRFRYWLFLPKRNLGPAIRLFTITWDLITFHPLHGVTAPQNTHAQKSVYRYISAYMRTVYMDVCMWDNLSFRKGQQGKSQLHDKKLRDGHNGVCIRLSPVSISIQGAAGSVWRRRNSVDPIVATYNDNNNIAPNNTP